MCSKCNDNIIYWIIYLDIVAVLIHAVTEQDSRFISFVDFLLFLISITATVSDLLLCIINTQNTMEVNI